MKLKIRVGLTIMVSMMSFSLSYCMIDKKMCEIDVAFQSFVDAVGKQPVVYIDEEVQASILKLQELCPDYGWSKFFGYLCKDLQEGGNLLLHKQMVQVVDECLKFCQDDLQKNVWYTDELKVIQAHLLDYYDFLSSKKSLVDVSSILLTKRKRCCVPCSNCYTLSALLVDGVDILPLLSTGTVSPVVGGYFSAYFMNSGSFLPIVNLPFTSANDISFSNVSVTDGSWTWSGSAPADFIANVTGTFLVSVTFAFKHDDAAGDEPFQSIYLRGTLDNVLIPFTTMYITDNLATAVETLGRQLTSTFIVSVNAGQTLRFQAASDISSGANFTYLGASLLPNEAVIALANIVRIR